MSRQTDRELVPTARRAWASLETLHVVGYFSPVLTEEYLALGLHRRLSYFATRAAAMGAVGPEVSEATFYVFAPWLHRKALPAAWEVVTPERLVQARRDGMATALRDILGEPDVGEALEIARRVTEGLTLPGRALYAAHAALPWPGTELLDLWHAATLVREHRGDGHVAVLTAAGIDPVEATVLDGVWSARSAFLHQTRGWTAEELAAAAGRLTERGWLDAEHHLTEAGRAARDEVESRTEAAALEGWRGVGRDEAERLAVLLSPLCAAVLEARLLPDDLAGSLRRTCET